MIKWKFLYKVKEIFFLCHVTFKFKRQTFQNNILNVDVWNCYICKAYSCIIYQSCNAEIPKLYTININIKSCPFGHESNSTVTGIFTKLVLKFCKEKWKLFYGDLIWSYSMVLSQSNVYIIDLCINGCFYPCWPNWMAESRILLMENKYPPPLCFIFLDFMLILG